jgi:GAF domain-containing protein
MQTPDRPLTTDAAFDAFARILATSGARDALAFIVGLSDYRFIGVFRFQDGKSNAAIHYDRLAPAQLQAQEVPESATYCSFVRDSRGLFATADAMRDPRLGTHVARQAVQAYCGIPILEPEGALLGTLCHYDTVPRDPEQLDLELMLRVASALAQGRHVPAYPQA